MKAQVVSFHCVLKNGLGQLINTSFNRDVITHVSGAPKVVNGLPAGLRDVKPGERRSIAVKAQEAYGLYDPALTRQASRRSLLSTGELAVDDRVHLADSFGDFQLYRITKIIGDLVYLDANHPLAGQDLTFDIHIVDARDATPEEMLESSIAPNPSFLQ
jgi:FKBP-type peptidyl-prolyl cis-trans isomerase SlyD